MEFFKDKIDGEIAEAEYRMRLARRDGHWLAYRDRKKQLERLLRRKGNGDRPR